MPPSHGGAGGSSVAVDGSAGKTDGYYYGELGFSGGGGGASVHLTGALAGNGGKGGDGGVDAGVGMGGIGGEAGATWSASGNASAPVIGQAGSDGGKPTQTSGTSWFAYDGYGGGGGGGGGFGAVVSAATQTVNSAVTGGAGGAGGSVTPSVAGGVGPYGGGGGGGQGGGGLLVTANAASVVNAAAIAGGNGGLGGNSLDGIRGAGGDGGAGVVFTGTSGALTNNATVTGGNGGAGAANGAGGVGVIGSDLAIINSGTISGGLAGDGESRANAIEFTSGTNTLELHAGSQINGNVAANGSLDTLVLGGATASSFNLDLVNNGFNGFEALDKTGAATWMVTGRADGLATTVRAGVLQLGDGVDLAGELNGASGTNARPAEGTGNGIGEAGGKGQAGVTVVGGQLAVMANSYVGGGQGGDGGDVYADIASGPVTAVGGAGGTGGAGVLITAGGLDNGGGIEGGRGGRGGYAGPNRQTLTLNSVSLAAASEPSSLTSGVGGHGGNGVETSSAGTVTNRDSIRGGSAGDGQYISFYDQSPAPISLTGGAGGAGGHGVFMTAAALLDNQGQVSGGYGGSGASVDAGTAATELTGGAGGAGGAGALLTVAGGTVSNGGGVYGGGGGYGGNAYTENAAAASTTAGAGGAGGDGVALLAAGTVTNTSYIQGGQGGNGAQKSSYLYGEDGSQTATAQGALAGAGGAGVSFLADGRLTNSADGTIMGGQGGSSNLYTGVYVNNNGEATLAQATIIASDSAAAGGAGLRVGGLASVTNDGTIAGGQGGGNSYGGGPGFARGGGGAVNSAYAYNFNGQQASVTVQGNAGGAGGAGAVLAGGGLITNNASGTLQGGAGGTASAYAYAQAYSVTTALTANAIGGAGGAGGAGADLSGGSTLVNSGAVAGGQGGDGGYASAQTYRYTAPPVTIMAAVAAVPAVTTTSATGGNGGTGGAGIQGNRATVVNQLGGSIVGGNGGIAGGAYVYSQDSNVDQSGPGITSTPGSVGAGGIGITGADLTVTNAGRIAGGFSGEGSSSGGSFPTLLAVAGRPVVAAAPTGTQAAAIQFTGGVNSLTLESTSVIEGQVIASSKADTLALGGATNGSFDVASAGPAAQYQGFGKFAKTGTSTWALTGATTAVTPWTVNAGTLSIASDASLGDVGGALTLAGGTLQTTADISTARAVTLTAPGGSLTTDAATTLALGGVVSGDGALTKAGAGTLRLTGANTYTGGTTIAAGTVIGGASSFGTGAIVDSGALVIDQASNATMANTLSGNGSLSKTGAGQVLFTGNGSAFTGTTTVSGGALSVNGTLGGASVFGSGTTLRGNGTIGTTLLASGATVAPGNSIGTLSVNGNFTFAPGSTYQVETDAAGHSDRLQVSGTATLGGANVDVLAATGNYATSTTYTILTAGTRVGTFGTLTSNFAFLTPSLSYPANSVVLTLARNNTSFQSIAATPNQAAAAGGLQSLASGPLFNAVVQLSAPTARSAFNQLSGEIHASAKTAMLEDSRFVREASLDRLRQSQGGSASGMSVQAQGNGNATWARVFGADGHIDGDGNASRLNRDIAGFLVGADTTLASGWQAGALAGYSKSDLDIDGLNSTAKADSYHVGVYGGTQWDATSLRLGASYTWNKLDTQRNVGFTGFGNSLKADYDISTAQVFGEVARRIDMGTVAVEPFAGLAYVNVDADGFNESGGAAALRSGGGSVDATFTTLGVRASTQLSDTTRLRGTIGWRHAFGDRVPTSTNAFATGSTFTVSGVPLAKDVAVVEAGIETQLQSNMTLGLSYAGQFGDGLKDHGFKVSLGWKF